MNQEEYLFVMIGAKEVAISMLKDKVSKLEAIVAEQNKRIKEFENAKTPDTDN